MEKMVSKEKLSKARDKLSKHLERYYGKIEWNHLIDRLKEKFPQKSDQEIIKKFEGNNRKYKVRDALRDSIQNFPYSDDYKTASLLKECERFGKMVDQLDPPEVQISSHLLSSTIEDTSPIYDLSEKIWYVYFFHIPNNTGRSNALPKLGRAVLKGKPNYKVELENLDEDGDINADNYYGDYFVMSISNTLIFNLYLTKPEHNSSEEQKITIKKYLQIRVPFDTIDDNIFVGSYNSLDNEQNYHGSILLQKTKDENPKPKIYCYFENKDEFDDEVDPRILKYLSRKVINYHLEPKFKSTTNQLEVLFNNYSPFKNIEQRFIEPPKPKLFFATPQSSISNYIENQDYVSKIHEVLNENFMSDLDIHFDKDWEEGSTLQNFRSLVNTRFFVLFINQETILSMSQIELGFALAFVKKVIIIAPSDIISDRVKSFENFGGGGTGSHESIKIKLIDSTNFHEQKKQEKVLSQLVHYIKVNSKIIKEK